jgi:hypothetical protein
MGTGNWFGIYVAILIFYWCKYAAVEDVFWLSLTHINSVAPPQKRKINFTASVVSRISYDEHSIRSKPLEYCFEELMCFEFFFGGGKFISKPLHVAYL